MAVVYVSEVAVMFVQGEWYCQSYYIHG